MSDDPARDERPVEPGGPGAAEGGEVSSPVDYRLRYQELFEFAPDCQLLTDAQGVIQEANHAAASLLRCPKEFLIGKPLGFFVMPGLRVRFYSCLLNLKRHDPWDTFRTCVGRAGEERDVVLRVAAVDGRASGQVVLHWLLRDITERRWHEAARAELIQRLLTAQEDERSRIARELHDEMGQHLTALIVDLKLLGDSFDFPEAARQHLERVRQAAGQLGRAVHHIAIELRPTSLDDLGLEVTMRNHVAAWSGHTGIRAEFCLVGPSDRRLASTVETTLYRIMQEALTNVVKHAMATLVSVILERREHSVRLIVEDNGRGFAAEDLGRAPQRGTGLGLVGIHERATLAGGTFDIESEPGGPTAIYVEIPTGEVSTDV
jgi:PAS domain S-box-containing protein